MNIQNKSYSFDNYNINLSYNPSNSIYIEIIFNTNQSTYTTTVRTIDLSNLNLDSFFNIIVKSFEFESNYKVNFDINDNFLNLTFYISFDNIFVINVAVRLDKVILLDNKLFINKLNEIETKYENEIKLLKYKIEQYEKIMHQYNFTPQSPPPPPPPPLYPSYSSYSPSYSPSYFPPKQETQVSSLELARTRARSIEKKYAKL